MSAQDDTPQLYLITPPSFDLDTFPGVLASVIERAEIACLRLSLASEDADDVARAADACRAVAHEADVALVMDRHLGMVERLGLDGVHLSGARGIRDARDTLGDDAIVGAFAGTSRHEGMNAGEAGADYVSFGPLRDTGLGTGDIAERELFGWWSEMIELPIVAEGGLTLDLVETLAPVTDFFAIGAEIWGADDPASALLALTSPLR